MRFFLIFPFLLLSCMQITKSTNKSVSAKTYFDKASSYKEKQNYTRALETLTSLRKQFFYSNYNKKAHLMTADIHFVMGHYVQASQTYKTHLNLYPDTKKDYVLYQLGLSYSEQLPKRNDKDLEKATPALIAFRTLLNLKIDSPYKKQAKEQIQKILDKKASKELQTANFYKKKGWKKASLNRIKYFIENYQQSPLMPKALLEGYQLANQLGKNTNIFKKILMKSYPKSQEAKNLKKNTATKKDTFFNKVKKSL